MEDIFNSKHLKGVMFITYILKLELHTYYRMLNSMKVFTYDKRLYSLFVHKCIHMYIYFSLHKCIHQQIIIFMKNEKPTDDDKINNMPVTKGTYWL